MSNRSETNSTSDPRWEWSVEAACDLLCGTPEDAITAVRVTLPLRHPSREALAVAVLGQRLAIEHDLDAAAKLTGRTVTIRLSRTAQAAGVPEAVSKARGQAADGE